MNCCIWTRLLRKATTLAITTIDVPTMAYILVLGPSKLPTRLVPGVSSTAQSPHLFLSYFATARRNVQLERERYLFDREAVRWGTDYMKLTCDSHFSAKRRTATCHRPGECSNCQANS